MTGRRGTVSRIVAAATVVVLVLVAAGCGGAAQPDESAGLGVPRVLAHAWADQASAIADAAAAGNSCRASHLASALRSQVIAAEGRVPNRLRAPLLSGVNALADRITCRQTVTVQSPPTQPKPHEKPPPKHDHHGHGGDEKKDHG